MGIDNLISNKFNAKILGKNYEIKYQVRNFIALKKKFNIEMHELVESVLNGDLEAIVRMIWCGTLIFNEFSVEDPVNIKEEIDLKGLYEMDSNELRQIGLEITKGLLASLPKDTKKKTKPTGMVVQALEKIKKLLKMK